MMELLQRLFVFEIWNTSDEVAPPFACMELDYAYESGNSAILVIDGPKLVLRVKKPTADNLSSPERFIFNGPFPIEPDGYGKGVKLPVNQCLMNLSTPPGPGENCGPQDDSWLLSVDGSGYVVKSIDSGLAYEDGATKTVFVESVGGGSSVKYFVLAEDASAMPVYAWAGVLGSSGIIAVDSNAEEPIELFYWQDVLRSPKMAKAGYAGIYGTDDESRNVFVAGPCISGCQTDSTITPGNPPNGTIGSPYSHTIGRTGLSGAGISATGLPPGLTINAETGAITGTPTQAGEYWVTLTGDSDDTPPCPITRIVKIVIAAAGGPGTEEPPGGGPV